MHSTISLHLGHSFRNLVDGKVTVKKSLKNGFMLLSTLCWMLLRSQEASRQQPGRIKVLANFEMSSLEGSFPSCSLVV